MIRTRYSKQATSRIGARLVQRRGTLRVCWQPPCAVPLDLRFVARNPPVGRSYDCRHSTPPTVGVPDSVAGRAAALRERSCWPRWILFSLVTELLGLGEIFFCFGVLVQLVVDDTIRKRALRAAAADKAFPLPQRLVELPADFRIGLVSRSGIEGTLQIIEFAVAVCNNG